MFGFMDAFGAAALLALAGDPARGVAGAAAGVSWAGLPQPVTTTAMIPTTV